MLKLGGVLRVNPPVRESRHNEPLWQALKSGVIDMIATDHAPHSIEEKTRPNIWECDCGFPGVETQMPIMLTEVNKGRASLTDYVLWSSVNPAKAWGLYGIKGLIATGAHADIAFVDLKKTGLINQSLFQTKAKISPWHGRAVHGMPVHTMVRGRFVVQNGRLLEETLGWGQNIKDVQTMPQPHPQNTEHYSSAMVKTQ